MRGRFSLTPHPSFGHLPLKGKAFKKTVPQGEAGLNDVTLWQYGFKIKLR